MAFVGILATASVLVLVDDGQRSFPARLAEGAAGLSPELPAGLVFQLGGPNDGEPINSRSVELKLSTNYRDQGRVSIYANDRYVSSHSLHAYGVVDSESGYLVSRIPIDLMDAVGAAEDRMTRPDTLDVRVRVYLYSTVQPSRLVTFAEWTCKVERPWLEFPTRAGTLAGVTIPGNKVPVVLHLLEGDSYYFVLASSRKEVLGRSPQDPSALREAGVVVGGNCRVEASPERASGTRGSQRVIFVDPTLGDGGSSLHIVMWTYDATRGWKRSAIEELPLR